MTDSLSALHEQFVSRVFHLIMPLHAMAEATLLPVPRRIANEGRNALAHVFWAENDVNTAISHWRKAISHLERAGLDLLKMLVHHLQSCRHQLNAEAVREIAHLSPLGATGGSSANRPATAADGPMPDEHNSFRQWWKLVEKLLTDPGIHLDLSESAAQKMQEEIVCTRDALALLDTPTLVNNNSLTIQPPGPELLAPFHDLQQLEARLQACAGMMGANTQGSWLSLLTDLASYMSGFSGAADDWTAKIRACRNGIRRMVAEWYLYNLEQEMRRTKTHDDQGATQFRLQIDAAVQDHESEYPDDTIIETLGQRLEAVLRDPTPAKRHPEDFIPPAWYLRRGMIVMLDLCGSTAITDTGDSRARRFTAVYRDIDRCMRRTLSTMAQRYGAIEYSVNTWGDAVLLVFDIDTFQTEPASQQELEDRRRKAYENLAEILQQCLPTIRHCLATHDFAMRGGVAAGEYQRLYNSLRDDLDVTGPAVFLAARLEPMAINGEVLIYPSLVMDTDNRSRETDDGGPQDHSASSSTSTPWPLLGWPTTHGYKACERKVVKHIDAGRCAVASGDGISLIRWKHPQSS